MVIVSPATGVIPLPNGWTSWLMHTGYPNYLPIGMILQVPFPKLTHSPSRKAVGRCLYFRLKWSLFRCYVSCREGNPYLFSTFFCLFFRFLPSKSRPVLLSHRAAWPGANVEPAGKPIQPWNGGISHNGKSTWNPKEGRFGRWFSLNHFGDVRFHVDFPGCIWRFPTKQNKGFSWWLVCMFGWITCRKKSSVWGSLPTQTWDIFTRVDQLKGMVIPPLLGNPKSF